LRLKLVEKKREAPLPAAAWYPFDTLSGVPAIAELMSPDYTAIANDIAGLPVADIGCADGDLAMLFAGWGAQVDAVDYAPNNYNRMQGVATLSRVLQLPVRAHDINLDRDFALPHDVYGLTLFLGTLYHLKNPYAVLERLAFQTRWCILSTRIAQLTPSVRARVETEPIAYLADGREIGNDATNFWIFSATGLFRILQRTRWAIVRTKRVGCSVDSDPIDPQADERMFVLLKSRVHFPGLDLRLGDGWYPIEESIRWTSTHFALEIVLPLEQPFSGFTLSVFVPRGIVPARLSCKIRGEEVGKAEYAEGGLSEFQGELPPFALHEPSLRLDFTVQNNFTPNDIETRPLGICIPSPIDFRLLTPTS